MTDPARAQDIFTAAMELHDPKARMELLDRECQQDEALRIRVERLLRAHDTANGFGSDWSGEELAVTEAMVSPIRPGTVVVGKYKLLERIGEGGMGVVWVAEQTEPLRRKVAIKLVKAGMDSRSVIARFEAERQAIALMDHPNIAQVFDAGTTSDGHPYFVMELVKGVPITEFCDTRRLSPLERLELFIPVCRAIQHAHQKGIIHRDIKPSNVLVALHDEQPIPKVIDFGVAKAIGQQLTERTLYTGFGALIGTPMYMAPEQATLNQLDVDTRADIYALGVLLYELLVGSPPFEASRLKQVALDEVLRMVREEEPPRPSARLSTSRTKATIAHVRQSDVERLTKIVRGELDWIVMKALEKDRNRRYGTAQGLATDIERYLSGEPVTAVPPSATYRLRKLIHRNRLLFTTATFCMALLVTATVISSLSAMRARRAQAFAIDRQQAALLHARLAEENLQRYHDALKNAEEQATENLRLAETAQAARREASELLGDMQAERGRSACQHSDFAEAAVWFANAALQTPHNSASQSTNLLMARNCWNRSPVPVARFKFPNRAIKRIEFQPNGPLLLALSDDRFALWNVHNEQSLAWSEEIRNVADSVWSPDGTRLAIGTTQGLVHIFEPASGNVLQTFDQQQLIRRMCWLPDGKRLVIAGVDAKLWKLTKEPECEHHWIHPRSIHSLTVNRRGDRVVTVSDDNLARVFAVAEGTSNAEPIFAIEHSPPRATVEEMAAPVFCQEDKQLVTIVDSEKLAAWDAESGKAIELPLSLGQTNFYQNLASSADGQWLSASREQHCLLWNLAGPSRLLPHNNAVRGVVFHPNRSLMLSTCYDGRCRLWSLPSEGDQPQVFPQLETFASGVISPSGDCLAVVGQRQVIVWRMPGSIPQLIEDMNWPGFKWRARASFDGTLVTPSLWHETPWGHQATQQPLTVISVSNGQPAGPAIKLADALYDSSICADNRSVAAVSQTDSAGWLEVFDIYSGRPKFAPVALPGKPISVATRPNSAQVAVLCANGHGEVRDAQLGSLVFEFECAGQGRGWPNARVLYSPDGATLICLAGKDRIWIREADTGELRCTPLNPATEFGPCRSLAVSLDNRWLASAVNGNNLVQVWDLATGKPVGQPLPHPGDLYGIFSVNFSPDGQLILTGHKDGNVRIWDWRQGRLVGTPLANEDEVYSATFTADGAYVVSAVRNSCVCIWSVATHRQITPALRYPKTEPEFSCGPLTLAGERVIASALGQPIYDLSELLKPPTLDPLTLLKSAELATNQRLSGGALIPLNQSEWDDRWQEMVVR